MKNTQFESFVTAKVRRKKFVMMFFDFWGMGGMGGAGGYGSHGAPGKFSKIKKAPKNNVLNVFLLWWYFYKTTWYNADHVLWFYFV